MSPLTLQILLGLADGDATSAELIHKVHDDDRGYSVIRDRSFYAALARLGNEGKIECEIDGYRQIRYRLTPFGRRLLKAESERLKRVVTLLGGRL